VKIILVYDIADTANGGARVLNKIFKLCNEYLFRVQNSVFEGELTESEYKKLKVRVEEIIRKDLDSVIVYKINNEKWLKCEQVGKKENYSSNIL